MQILRLICILSFIISLKLVIGLEWIKISPTSDTMNDFPTNITAGILEHDFGNIYLLLGHREIWPPDGSERSITFQNDVYSYNIDDNEWSKVSVIGSKPLARAYSAGTYEPFSRRIYICGGTIFDNNFQNIQLFDDFWFYDSVTRTFTQINRNNNLLWPGNRASSRLFNAGDKLYLFGGISNIEPTFGLPIYTNELWEFNLITEIWMPIFTEDLEPSPRGVPQDFQILGQLYINGGEFFNLDTFSFETPNDTWRFNFFTKKWHNTNSILIPARNYAASFRFGFNWGIYAGEIDNGEEGQSGCGAPFPQNIGNDLWIYHTIFNFWQKQFPTGTLPPPLKRTMAVGVGLHSAYMFSGFSFSCSISQEPGQIYNNHIYKLII